MTLLAISQGSVSVTLKVGSNEALDKTLLALGSIQYTHVQSSCDRLIRITFKEQNWRIDDVAKGTSFTGEHLGDFAYSLSDCIIYHIADQTNNAHCIHGASVLIDNKVVLIPGNSGAGKSSLTAWLVSQGASYITDELSILHPNGMVTGVPRPIQIKHHGITAVKPLMTEPERLLMGGQVNALPVQSLSGTVCLEAKPLGVIIFPEFSVTSNFQCTTLTPAKAGMSLMEGYVNARNMKEYGFSLLMALIREKAAYTLAYGDYNQLDLCHAPFNWPDKH